MALPSASRYGLFMLVPERALLAGTKVVIVFGRWLRPGATAQSLGLMASVSRLLPRRGVRLTPKALTLLEHCTASSTVQPNV